VIVDASRHIKGVSDGNRTRHGPNHAMLSWRGSRLLTRSRSAFWFYFGGAVFLRFDVQHARKQSRATARPLHRSRPSPWRPHHLPISRRGGRHHRMV
jgi:hypothetical protein